MAVINATNSNNPQMGVQNGGVVTNPNAELTNDQFMQLLLTELQYQDPTEPMDSDKILTQTSQLATLESADKINNSMASVVESMEKQQSMGALSAIGKMASVGSDAIEYYQGYPSQFEVYFPEEISDGTLSIMDLNGKTVKTIDLDSLEGEQGVLAFEWDGKNSAGEQMESGYYRVQANYKNKDGEAVETSFGVYPVESVRFDQGEAYMKLGSSYVPMDYIAEFY